MTYDSVLEHFANAVEMTQAELAELRKDFGEWLKDRGHDPFLAVRSRLILVGIRYQEGGVDLWCGRVLAKYDWEEAELEAKINERAERIYEILQKNTSLESPSFNELALILATDEPHIMEALEVLAEQGKIRKAGVGMYDLYLPSEPSSKPADNATSSHVE